MRKIIPLLRGYFSFAAYHTSSKEYNNAFDIEYTMTYNRVYDATLLLEEGNTQTEKKIIQVLKSHMFQI
jgi:hypothetical protein